MYDKLKSHSVMKSDFISAFAHGHARMHHNTSVFVADQHPKGHQDQNPNIRREQARLQAVKCTGGKWPNSRGEN